MKNQQDLKQMSLTELRQEIMLGVEAMRAGRYTVYRSQEELDKLGDEIITQGRARLAKRKTEQLNDL